MNVPADSTARVLTAPEAEGEWDLVVIGGGTAGLVASRSAAQLGARTLLIEADRLGGECLYTGCVPSKALIAAASVAHAARTAERFGVHTGTVTVDFARVMAHVQSAIAQIEPVDSADALVAAGVHVLFGRAAFVAPDALEVDGAVIRFRDALIATGSRPKLPRIPGADAAELLTHENLWDVTEQPRRLLVLGGGATACELGQAMARLGTTVTIACESERLLPREDPRASRVVLEALRAEGVDVRLGTTATRVDGRAVLLSDGTEVTDARILAAIGRYVETAGLGLGPAGVAVDEDGAIAVDATMRTSNRRIRAAGDATPLPRYTHTAGMFASVAALNAVLGLSRRADTEVLPRVTFTAPEVASVGMSPADGRARGWRVITESHDDVDRPITDAATEGFATLVVDGRGRLRGATIVSARAGEVIGEMSTAIRGGLHIRDLATTTHPYPTYADTAWNPITRAAQQDLGHGAWGAAIRALRAVRDRRG